MVGRGRRQVRNDIHVGGSGDDFETALRHVGGVVTRIVVVDSGEHDGVERFSRHGCSVVIPLKRGTGIYVFDGELHDAADLGETAALELWGLQEKAFTHIRDNGFGCVARMPIVTG